MRGRAKAKEIHILATHEVFSPPALEHLNRPSVKELVVCNTLPLAEDPSYPKLKLLSVAPLFAGRSNGSTKTCP